MPAAKAALLHETLGWLLRQETVDVDAVGSALGIFVWACSVRREVLSALSACFLFVDKLRGRRARWWPSAWAELNMARDLIPLLYASLGAPLCDLVGATDAMGAEDGGDYGGFGVVAAAVPHEVALEALSVGVQPVRLARPDRPDLALCALEAQLPGPPDT